MTQDEKQILIAKHRGWKIDDELEDGALMGVPPGQQEGTTAGWDMVPDYFLDLNAMHEAEKELTPHDQWVYLNHIANIVKPGSNSEQMQLFTPFSTAAQRAEAFGLTLTLWT